MSLRPYQIKADQEIKAHFRAGRKKVLLRMATGAGKTVIFSHVLKSAAAKGTRCVMAVAGRSLVEQAHERLLRENVLHGVQMGNHWAKNPLALVQICSIDTLNARSKYPEAQLVIIDEAHLATSDKFHRFVERYPNAFFLSVTATPYCRESLRHIADVCVSPISMTELIEQGYLVPGRVFAPSTPDLKGLRKQNGEWISSQVEERMNTLTGDIINHWRKLGENRPTIGFACNLTHSIGLAAAFNAAGIPAEHIEGNNSSTERKAAIERLRTGRTKVLFNVGILCTGVDIPFASCGIMARPTESYSLYVQQTGRLTRICADTGKQNYILLDHAGNALKHGFVTDEPEVDLDGRKPKEDMGQAPIRCDNCLQVYEHSEPRCPHCGHGKPIRRKESNVQEVDGTLEEIKELPEAAQISAYFRRLKETQKKRGYKPAWIHFQLRDKYGQEVADTLKPLRKLPPWLK